MHVPAPGPVRQSLALSATIQNSRRGGSSDTGGEGEVLSTGPNLSPLDESFILLAPREHLMGHATDTNIFAHWSHSRSPSNGPGDLIGANTSPIPDL